MPENNIYNGVNADRAASLIKSLIASSDPDKKFSRSTFLYNNKQAYVNSKGTIIIIFDKLIHEIPCRCNLKAIEKISKIEGRIAAECEEYAMLDGSGVFKIKSFFEEYSMNIMDLAPHNAFAFTPEGPFVFLNQVLDILSIFPGARLIALRLKGDPLSTYLKFIDSYGNMALLAGCNVDKPLPVSDPDMIVKSLRKEDAEEAYAQLVSASRVAICDDDD